MVVFENAFLRLDYDPAHDILTGQLPDIQEYSLDQVKETFKTIASTIRHYDVKRYLMDTRRSVINVENDQYTALVSDFALELQTTRLEKFARLQTPSTAREFAIKAVKEKFNPPYKIQAFTSETEALDWLKEESE